MLKLIHPKKGVVREVPKNYHNKIAILKRAGFVPFDTYRPKKKKVIVPDPTVAEIVAKNKEEEVEQSDEPVTEIAIHVSPAARAVIEEHDLDPALIEGTGKDGSIIKPDVVAHLESLEEKELENVPENVQDSEENLEEVEDIVPDIVPENVPEDIQTHDDSPEGKYPEGEEKRAEESGPGQEAE